MTIPVYRHNQDHDDWEVASVYDSDDCGSLGGSTHNESLHSPDYVDNTGLRLEGHSYDSTCPRFVNGYPVPQQQHQNFPPATLACPGWDAHYMSGKQISFVVPPPGVIFPRKDWDYLTQDTYWPSTTPQMASRSDMPGTGVMESPPPASLLLSPSSPTPAPSLLVKRPPLATTAAHGPLPHMTPGTGANADVHGCPIMPPPPRYHDVAHAIPPRLVDAGCQAQSSTAMSPPRRPGHDVLSSHAPGPGFGSMPWGPRSREEPAGAEGRSGGGVSRGRPSHGSGDPSQVPSKYEREHELEQDGGRTRTARLQMLHRRPSVWQRFVRRFSPSHVSVGQT